MIVSNTLNPDIKLYKLELSRDLLEARSRRIPTNIMHNAYRERTSLIA